MTHRMTDVETILYAAMVMRQQHGPDHPRHKMWAAMADLLRDHAEEVDALNAHISDTRLKVMVHVRVLAVANAYFDALADKFEAAEPKDTL